jgi:hypothetical protein
LSNAGCSTSHSAAFRRLRCLGKSPNDLLAVHCRTSFSDNDASPEADRSPSLPLAPPSAMRLRSAFRSYRERAPIQVIFHPISHPFRSPFVPMVSPVPIHPALFLSGLLWNSKQLQPVIRQIPTS